MQVGKLRLRVLLETDDLSGYTCIGIARIAETRQDKNILLDDKYIPTVLDCQAAPRLNGFIVELAGMLRHRAEAIAGRLADTRRGGTAEVTDYMLLQTLNRLEPIMVHLAKVQGLHPVELFKECMGAIGELATFNTKITARQNCPCICTTIYKRALKLCLLTCANCSPRFTSKPPFQSEWRIRGTVFVWRTNTISH